MKKLTNKRGFTLIEVVLVLAIGGLIFLLAFIAFQQVSANRRDTQRRADAGRIVAEIQTYLGDSKAATVLTTTSVTDGSDVANTGICTTNTTTNNIATFSTNYLCKNGKFLSPDGRNYNTSAYNDAAPLAKDAVRIYHNLTHFGPFFAPTAYNSCNGASSRPGDFKVVIGLEKGIACRDFN